MARVDRAGLHSRGDDKSVKVEQKTFEPHPEGWFQFHLGDPELVEADFQGQKRQRLKWPCTSSEKKDDGERHVLNLFTGVAMTSHPADKHRALVQDGFGLDPDTYEDTDEIVGQLFCGKVERDKATGKTSIVAFDTKDRVKPRGAKAKATKAETDPFEEE